MIGQGLPEDCHRGSPGNPCAHLTIGQCWRLAHVAISLCSEVTFSDGWCHTIGKSYLDASLQICNFLRAALCQRGYDDPDCYAFPSHLSSQIGQMAVRWVFLHMHITHLKQQLDPM